MADTDKHGETKAFYNQLYAAVVFGLGGAMMMFSMNFPTFGIPSMLRDPNFEITVEQSTLLASMVPLAAIVGNAAAGNLVETVGRKKTMLLGGSLFSLALPLLALSPSFGFALVARLLAGVSGSMIMIGGMLLLMEVSHPSVRDRVGSFAGILINGGMLAAFVLGSSFEWRTTTGLGVFIVLPFMVLLWGLTESPLYFVKRGKLEEALASLKLYRSSASIANKELKDLIAATRKTKGSSVSFGDIFRAPYSKPVIAVTLLLLAQQLTGLVGITTNAVKIFNALGTTIDPAYCTVMIGVVNMISAVVAAEVHSRFDRKPTLLVTTAVCVLMELFFAFFFWARANGGETLREWTDNNSNLALMSILVYFVSIGIGVGMMPFMYMGEAIPSKIKGLASAFSLTLRLVFVFVVLQTFNPLVNLIGYHYLFLSLAVLSTVTVLTAHSLMIETRGRSISEIDEYYNYLMEKKKK